MSIENPKKPKNPHLKIVPKEDSATENLDNKKNEISELHLSSIKDLEFCENIEEVIEIDENSRKVILDKLKQLLEQVENLNNSDDKVRVNLGLSLRIYNQIYRFEVDEDKKEKIKQGIGQIEFALRQLLLS